MSRNLEQLAVTFADTLAGGGPGQWKVQAAAAGAGVAPYMQVGTTRFAGPHNDFLKTAAETGLPGLAAYLLVFAAAFCMGWRKIRGKTGSPLMSKKKETACLLGGLASYLVISFFSMPASRIYPGIFLMAMLAMLQAGRDGAFSGLVSLVTNPDGSHNTVAYFWLTGILSSFLDNAPTYLVFFELAGGNPQVLMTTGALTLAAVSAGAVFMGANTYIGNAPNFMVYAIAKDRKVKMPSFFGYMAWSGAILIPIFLLQTVIFFR